MNALRYGLFSKTIVLTNESPEMFQQLLQQYVAKFQPADDVEQDLVDDMVAAKWRQRRVWIIETALLDLKMDAQEDEIAKTFRQIDQATRLALAHKEAMPQLASLERAEASYRRQYDRALKNLLQLRKVLAQPLAPIAEAPVQNEPTAPSPEPAPPPAPLQNEPNQPPPTARNQADTDLDPEVVASLSPYLRQKLGFDVKDAA